MRPVNLLPARYRPARPTGRRPGIGYAAIAALAVLLLMVVLYVVTQNGINDAKDKTAKAKQEQAAAEARIGQLQAYGNFASLRATREAAVRNVATVRFDYERLMREMALVLPHDTYLTSLNASADGASSAGAEATSTSGTTTASGPNVTVAGCAPSHRGVANAIVRMRQLHNVVDVNLQSDSQGGSPSEGSGSTSSSGGGVCKNQFNATITLQPESPSTENQPVPARLGGGQ